MSNNNKTNSDSSSPWPEIEDGAVAFLLDARDDFEARLLRDWVEAQKPEPGSHPRYSFVRLPKNGASNLLDALPEPGDALWMQPLRIAWMPASQTAGRRTLRDLFHGRITEPGTVRRWWLAKHQPDRVAYIAGDGAYLDELRERLAGASGDELSEFIANQASIALERSERTARGARYKVPRIRHSDVFANADFQNLIANVAQQRDRSEHEVLEQAARYLREMAATQTPFTLDVMNSLYRAAVRSHHDAKINIDESQLKRVTETLGTRIPDQSQVDARHDGSIARPV